MKTIHIPNGRITLPESKAVCPYCTYKIPFNVLEKKFNKDHTIRMKCKCKRFIGITQDIQGDYVAFELINSYLY